MSNESAPGAKWVLLKMQIGPVQEFIAQARSTRDLWSGSYLLSWLMANAAQRLQSDFKAALIFPCPEDQPLLEYWKGNLGLESQAKLTTPNLPNVLLARMPGDLERGKEAAQVVERVFSGAEDCYWGRIATASRECLEKRGAPFAAWQRERWEFQVRNLWQVTWAVWPEGGLRWDRNYEAVSHALDMRRQTRDFVAWQSPGIGRHRDELTGKEEAIATREWLGRASQKGLSFRFRKRDELGATSLIKRVWDLGFLEEESRIKRPPTFDSTADVAAAPWRKAFREAILAPKFDTPEEATRLEAALLRYIAACPLRFGEGSSPIRSQALRGIRPSAGASGRFLRHEGRSRSTEKGCRLRDDRR